MTNHLFQRIRQAAEGYESHKLLEIPAGFSLTYSDMLALSGPYAATLLELGAKPGERIAVQIEKSPDAILLYLGAIRAGVIFLPSTRPTQTRNLGIFLPTLSRKSWSAIRRAIILCRS